MSAQYDAAGAVAAGTMYWSYDESDGYGLLAPDGSEKSALVDAVVRPYPARVAGDPIRTRSTRRRARSHFAYTPDRAATLPTEIAVPDRVYPSGYVVDCGGCAYEMQPGRARARHAAAGRAGDGGHRA